MAGRALRGFGPARRDPFVSAKGPKTIGARAWPFGCLCPGPERLGLRNSLRSNSPRPSLQSSGLGRSLARRRHEVAPFDGAGGNAKLLRQDTEGWIPDY